MLKNKKAVILILLNIVIWSFFAYRLYTAYTAYSESDFEPEILVNKEKLTKDSALYKLNLTYKDPFLKGEFKNTVSSGIAVKSVSKPIKTEPQKTPTVSTKAVLDIKYLGLIKNSNSGVVTALVSVNGQSRFVKVNDVLEGITIRKIDNSELEGTMGKEKVVIRR